MSFETRKIRPVRENGRNSDQITHHKPTKIWKRLVLLIIILLVILGRFTNI